MIDEALRYHRLGWSIIPVSRENKIPIIKWTEYQIRLATEEEICGWWRQFADANIGLVCGRTSGVIVFDCDDGDAIDYMRRNGLASTVEAQSSKEMKRHYYYRYPSVDTNQDFIYSNIARVSDRGKKIALDVRSNGGLVVLPPSLHKSGVRYQWIHGPFEHDMVELDQWQFELFHRKHNKTPYERIVDRPKTLGLHFMRILTQGSTEGARDIEGYTLALQMRKCGFRRDLIESKMKEWSVRCTPPFSDKETRKILKSAFSRRI